MSTQPAQEKENEGASQIPSARMAEVELRLLSEASAALTVSLDLQGTLDRVARVAVPVLADWCVVDILESCDSPLTDTTRVRRAAAVHADPAHQQTLDELTRRYPPRSDRPTLARTALATGIAELVTDVQDEVIDQLAHDAEQASLIRKIGLRSYMVVPLAARGRLVGVIAFLSARRRYRHDDLSVAEELARRMAMAVDNAMLFREAQAAADRMARLQSVTAALAGALTAAEVGEIVIREVIAVLGAANGVLCLASEDGASLRIARSVGMSDEVLSVFEQFSVDAPLPLCDAVRAREPLFLESRAEVVSRYPDLRDLNSRARANSWAAVPLMRHGVLVGGLAFGFDVSRRFAADERAFVIALAQQCEQALERARLLASEREARSDAEQARRRADEANRAKTEFLAVMSHELRTPLNAIAGYAELLEMGLHGPLNEGQRDAIARIQRSERHLHTLINDVLHLAKIEAGHVEMAITPVLVPDALISLEALIAPMLRQKGLSYSCCAGTEEAVVQADPEKLRQILLNLVSNAIKFTPTGGRVGVCCTVLADAIRLEVHDTGHGIPPDKLQRIFEPFVQLDTDRGQAHEGTGLGLAISRDLARAMGGDIVAESRLGHGSTFVLELPRAQPPQDAAHAV